MTRILLDEVLSQLTAVGTLRRAIAIGRVHHAYLFDGPDGVGKELAAFGLAQALVCEKREANAGSPEAQSAAACGDCSACRRAIPKEQTRRPVHPDVAVVERGLYEAAQIGRRTPELQDISIDQVRTLVLARAAFPPHEGRAKVFIVRRAEELSISAANALLKTLEEPGDKTHFILLSSEPDTLLPTIRSRTQRVRFAALPDDVVEKLLTARGVTQTHEIARLAAGSMAAALSLADPEETARRDAFVARALRAVDQDDLGGALDLAEEAKKTPKPGLTLQILALAQALAERVRKSVGENDPAPRADADAVRYSFALSSVKELEGNAGPQLVIESMLTKMRAA